MSKTLADVKDQYELNAQRIAGNIGLGVRISLAGHECPPWGGKRPCDHVHGDRYRVTLTSGGKDFSFDFWNSLRDKTDGVAPSVYDVLACVASDASMPTDPDEVVEEFGEMKPSQAIAIAARAKELQAYFTLTELAALSEIQ